MKWPLEICKRILPVELLKKLDLKQMQSFGEVRNSIDGWTRSELLCILPVKHTSSNVYFILEHKSNSRKPYLRQINNLLESFPMKYGDMALIITDQKNQKKKECSCNWSPSEYWNISDEVYDRLTGERQEYNIKLFDLAIVNPETIDMNFIMRTILYTVKHAGSEEILEKLNTVSNLLLKSFKYEEPEQSLLTRISAYVYIHWKHNPEVINKLQNIIKNPELSRYVLNSADSIYSKGMAKGQIKGQMEGKTETALALLKNKVSIEIIMNSTGLSYHQLEEAGVLPRGKTHPPGGS